MRGRMADLVHSVAVSVVDIVPVSCAGHRQQTVSTVRAVQAGAKHVYGIERSAIADQAELIVKDNGYDDRVTIIKGVLIQRGLVGRLC